MLFLSALFAVSAWAQQFPERTLVFGMHYDGSKFYRIPALTVAKDGSLVAIADKRGNSIGDLPNEITIVSRRSADNGKTWSEPVVVAQGGNGKTYGDPAVVLDKKTGNLLCIFVGDKGLWDATPASRQGVYISKSKDNGRTWSSPRAITDQLYKGKDWYAGFAGSGNALQLRNGRLMFVLTARPDSRTYGSLHDYACYSDDGGDTWKVSALAESEGDEAKVVELENGDILMSIRNPKKGYRKFCVSTDGGETWGQSYTNPDLKDPACNGDIIRYSYSSDGQSRLLHSLPASSSARENVTVYLSYDEGKTWKIGKRISDGHSAYSSLTVLPDGTIGALVEEGKWDPNIPGEDGYGLYFIRFTLDYLTGEASEARGQKKTTLDKGWKFTRSDDAAFSRSDYDDSGWQSVTVPHDWAIYGPFSILHDQQKVAITQDGQKEAMEHAGRTGGLPFVGTGWYRIPFTVSPFREGKKTTLLFDGAMSHARIYVNGKEAGYWPYGYNSFSVDITPYLSAGGENLLAVRLENEEESSRWYPGAGLYRNVHLIENEGAHVPLWGTQITTPEIRNNYARVLLKTSLVIPEGEKPASYRIVTEIHNAQGQVAATHEGRLSDFDEQLFRQELIVENPVLWSPDSPYLYKAVSKIFRGEQLEDEYTTPFGIRSIEVIPDKGFFLNGERTMLRGVCNHHDLGPLGSAVNDAAIRRQVRLLKDMGCNAIRTSHNMPAPELVRACDEMGMMLMVETFDEWKAAKCRNGYNKLFDEWAEKDLVNVLRHYRNNPSVIMWCIGNEVPEQRNRDAGPKRTLFLQSICHREDPTRPVTQGMDAPDAVTDGNMAAVMDVAGFNYRPHKYLENYKKLPQRIILGSETASTVSSRGIYKFPVARASMKKYDDHQSSSYDVEHCGWSNLPEDDFIWHDDYPYCIGEFVWTGFDYLGEPTPYYTDWPSHSSLFGIIDLAGLPKDRYYLYRSHWNKKEETLHILPHWNWEGREGEITPVFVYTNHPSAELFINGKSQGKRTKDLSVTIENSADSASLADLKRQQRYRLMWMDTRYEPGTVKVVAYDEKGNAVAEKEIRTAGKPHRIELIPDRQTLKADGKDLCFVTVRVVDKDGNFCPAATDEIRFNVKGAGAYLAGANGNPASLESFQTPRMKLFSGMMTAVVQTSEKPGQIVLEASGKGLKKASLRIDSE